MADGTLVSISMLWSRHEIPVFESNRFLRTLHCVLRLPRGRSVHFGTIYADDLAGSLITNVAVQPRQGFERYLERKVSIPLPVSHLQTIDRRAINKLHEDLVHD